MMDYPFYVEYSFFDKVWDIVEVGGGYECGAYYDVMHFSVPDEQEAKAAVVLLNKLYANQRESSDDSV